MRASGRAEQHGRSERLEYWPRDFVSNLIPVTLRNIVGGAVFVAAMYWLAYLRPSTRGLVSDATMQEDHS